MEKIFNTNSHFKVIINILRKYNSIFIVIVLSILMIFLSPAFLTINNLINLIRQISVIGILAFGSTIVIISGEFDISIGALMSFVGVIVAGQIVEGYPIWISIPIGLFAGMIVGLINGLIVTKLKINAFITTLGTMYLIRGIANIYTGGNMVQTMAAVYPEFAFIGKGLIKNIPVPVIIMIVISIICQIFLSKSKIGRIIYSIGSNPNASKFSGINVDFYKIISFVIGGLLAAIGGVILSARLGIVDASVGIGYEFDAITAVVLGGTSLKGGKGNIYLTLIGALIIGLVRNGLNLLLVSTQLQSIFTGLIFIFVVAVAREDK